ncbi:MAG: ATP-binding protein, partial [Acidobacteriota bacterium]
IGLVRTLSTSGDPARPAVLVLRSRTAHMEFLSSLRWHLALTGLAAVLVSTLIGYLVARSVTRPLRALTNTMREMASSGDLTRPLPAIGRWDDEDVRMVETTFRQLAGAIDRFQREASRKDRLSSLGRMSTVVAHEIRNPLMIIKAAARSLRRHVDPAIAETAASIDEEVVRLNGVVTGVLDFARPIQFSLAPADLAEICHAAARAAEASSADMPVAVSVDVPSSPAAIVTDAERLRSVIVNLLDNAKQALWARPDSAASVKRPALRLTRVSEAWWRIDVADLGAGIALDDLPRIFDPYFTTRRTGSGLGLAIARNIIEGLGGKMTIESRLGEGTTVRIDLPHREDTRG